MTAANQNTHKIAEKQERDGNSLNSVVGWSSFKEQEMACKYSGETGNKYFINKQTDTTLNPKKPAEQKAKAEIKIE